MSIATNSNEKVQLNTSYIGEGTKLFHVSVGGNGWDCEGALWLVAADSLPQAYETAKAEYGADEQPEWWDGYEIGAIL